LRRADPAAERNRSGARDAGGGHRHDDEGAFADIDTPADYAQFIIRNLPAGDIPPSAEDR
jgi:hypothetical protein